MHVHTVAPEVVVSRQNSHTSRQPCEQPIETLQLDARSFEAALKDHGEREKPLFDERRRLARFMALHNMQAGVVG